MRDRTPGALEHRYEWPDGREMWIDLRAYPTPDGGVACFWRDITDRKAAEEVLRASEDRNAFLVRFSDLVRGLTDPMHIARESCRILTEQLHTERTVWAVLDWETREYVADWSFLADGTLVEPSRWPFDEEQPFAREHLAGRPVVYDDAFADSRIPDPVRAAMAERGLLAGIAVPVMVAGRLLAVLNTSQSVAPRRWRPEEVAFVEALAQRSWAEIERARAETGKRASEARYRALFESMDEGYCIIQMIFDDRGEPVDYLFVEANEALERHSGLKDVVGKRMLEMVPDHERKWFEIYGRVAMTGEPIRFEQAGEHLPNPSTYELYAFRIGEPERREVAVLFIDIGPRRRAEGALRESEARLAVLLNLTDVLRPLTDPIAVLGEATRILGEYMQADRTFIAMMEPDEVNLDVYHEYLRPGASSVIGHHNFDSFGAFVSPRLVAGEIMAVEDVGMLALTPAERKHYAAVGIAAYLLVPLVRDGRFAACFTCNHQTPRAWTEADKNIVRQVADRTWAALERARAEAALRESEVRFSQFAAASSDVLWIRDAKTLDVEFASPAMTSIFGVTPEEAVADARILTAIILPDDREDVDHCVAEVLAGRPVVHDYRIRRPGDGTFRWIRSTGFPILDDAGTVVRVAGISQDITDAKISVEHQGVLLAELQHRVRNIMAMIRSMTVRTADRAADVEDYRRLLQGRLMALARVQVLLTREANAGGSLRDIIASEVMAQAHRDDQFVLEGPQVTLSPKAVEVLTLAFHELATNALKYGAFSVPEGQLRVSWSIFEKRSRPWVRLDWIEVGAPPREPSTRRGFGSDLIEGRIPYELGGNGKMTLEQDGARCRLEFPLKDGESILETDAPKPTTIFGGTLDMTDAPDLAGRTVLVVEDDYYLAGDTAAALRGAGAEVLGPCPSEDATLDLLETQEPTHAVLDLNLGGGGPRFEIARLLQARGVPFLFLTGYDPDVVPAELRDIQRLQKPTQPRQIVEAIAQL